VNKTGITPRVSIVYLQRLADPTRPYNPTAGASDPTYNPYRTVDSAAIDLVAFNGWDVDDRTPEGMQGSAPSSDATAVAMLASRQRGDTNILATDGKNNFWVQHLELTPTATATPVPQAEVVLNGTSFGVGSPFTATFKLNQSIEQPFTAYAVVELPDKSMLDALTLGPAIVPVAENVPRLDPMTYPLMNLNIPAGAPMGNYRVMAGFFTPGQPITKPEDAFLLATSPFTVR